MPLSQGIVGHVASTGLMMNVKDVYKWVGHHAVPLPLPLPLSHPFFYPKVDERTGFKTRNILCFPIKDSASNLVGVAELCNKIGRDAFTKHDEQIAATVGGGRVRAVRIPRSPLSPPNSPPSNPSIPVRRLLRHQPFARELVRSTGWLAD